MEKAIKTILQTYKADLQKIDSEVVVTVIDRDYFTIIEEFKCLGLDFKQIDLTQNINCTITFGLKQIFDLNNLSMDKFLNTNLNHFILSTAKDYDMTYEAVEVYYERYGSTNEFYERLEEHIKNRSW